MGKIIHSCCQPEPYINSCGSFKCELVYACFKIPVIGRIDLARFSHAVLTYVLILNEKKKTHGDAVMVRRAFDLASTLRSRHGFLVRLAPSKMLGRFPIQPPEAQPRHPTGAFR